MGIKGGLSGLFSGLSANTSPSTWTGAGVDGGSVFSPTGPTPQDFGVDPNATPVNPYVPIDLNNPGDVQLTTEG